MEGETKRNELESLIEAIKGSDVLECRISLISQLENVNDFNQSESSFQALLLEYLVEFWEDSTCLGMPQCMLNKTILSVASKYLESDMHNCLRKFLVLGTKAIKWCERHLETTIPSIGESQDENCSSIFYQIILNTLSLSSSVIITLTRSPVFGEKELVLIIEDFILELLNLTKTSVVETKKIPSISSEIVKLTQVIVDAVVKLCRTYCQAVKWDFYKMNADRNKEMIEVGVDLASHVVNITACTIKYLYELGMFAAGGGGSLVTLLNVSWKGVVSLLQLGKGFLTEKVNVADIILNLVSLVIESLRCASEAWYMTLQDTLTGAEAKRIFLPIKFYLINAVRISSEYPYEAIDVYRELTRCALLISSLGISFSKETKLRAASEALAEFVEPTSLLLLHTLLNTANINLESRLQILDWLLSNENDSKSTVVVENADSSSGSTSLGSIFLVNCDDVPMARAVLLGRLMLFLNLLKTSPVLREEIVIGISRKLDCLLHMIMHEEVYSLALGLEITVNCVVGPNSGVTWQPMFYFILHSLKIFMIVAASSGPAWMEVEFFLLRNICHPHFLCLEIITEMYCFLLRHGETNMTSYILDRLCSVLKFVASSEPDLRPLDTLRKISRLVCVSLSYVCPAAVDRFYKLVESEDEPNLSQILYLALLIEGFPLESLPDESKMIAIRKLVTSFYHFAENKAKEQELGLINSTEFCNSSSVGLPVHALSSALQCCQVKDSDIAGDKNMAHIVNFAVVVIHGYKSAIDLKKDIFATLLSATLVIISNMRNFYGSAKMERLIVELHTLFMQCPTDADGMLYQCKPSLAYFMASLSHMEIAEGEGQTLCTAVWDLYHMLLRERHWAIVHLVIVAFGYFAARTSCTQLWRFVPHDATLSFDTHTGTEANEDRFMSELKCVLEKEVALCDVTPSKEQLHLLQEGIVLRKLGKVACNNSKVSGSKQLEIDKNSVKNRKRKLLDRICEGMELLQSGVKVMNDALAQSDATDLKDTLSSHILCLEDVISHLVGSTNQV
ncbi:hypothetical protein OPV22_032411 [Ensete ventricosum]|uniref:Uncharacterized protein n=1 Tax=Ensete ventricosum TaxID=4639 RepID=A0AAV8PPI3_ENSVE|nr:hypothetical protein OPV22_032411 [Ensete ventricosum]